jgi:UDP-N-acetyl-D-mannosaminuronic acid transferase (WecB/TagA/CpsF family)
VVNFLYFANAVQYHVLELDRYKKSADKIYARSLTASDFLLPDGIALQVWSYFDSGRKYRLQNLNGTDLTPKILSYLSNRYSVNLFVYSLYDEKIDK